jgi:hypothetical protein
MNASEVLALVSTILVLIVGLELRVKALVKTYLSELKPNSGTSIKDQISRLESRQTEIIDFIKTYK